MAKSDKSKSKKQNEPVVDLSFYVGELVDFLEESISRFAADLPDVEVSCVALYLTNYGTSVWINYETQAHSDAWVKKHQGKQDYLIGKDAKGLFNKLPNEFEYGQNDEFDFETLPDYYGDAWPMKFRGLNGKVKEVDSADESVARVLLESLEPALKSFDSLGDLKRSDVFRMGICVHNTACEAFWIHALAGSAKRRPAK